MKFLAGILVILSVGLGLSSLGAQTIRFKPLAKAQGGAAKVSGSACVLLDDQGTLATVAQLGVDLSKASMLMDGSEVPLEFVGADRDSRLAIYRVSGASLDALPAPPKLGSSRGLTPSTEVYTSANGQTQPARVVSKVHWFQSRVLPLAVLRVNHSQLPPAAGSALFDAEGRVVGLVRQTAHNSKTSSYCLPVEVISRTLEDLRHNKLVNRCWIGVIMDQLVAEPIIEGVRPGSPASKAGLRKGDVILSIGGRDVSDYAEVVDAFYYLVAGASTQFRIIRGTEVMELDVLAEAVPGSRPAP